VAVGVSPRGLGRLSRGLGVNARMADRDRPRPMLPLSDVLHAAREIEFLVIAGRRGALVVGVDRVAKLFNILNSDVRVQILKELALNGSCSFSELHRVSKVSAGTLAYHLSLLKELVSKRGNDYSLTEMGRYAHKLIKEVEDFENAVRPSR